MFSEKFMVFIRFGMQMAAAVMELAEPSNRLAGYPPLGSAWLQILASQALDKIDHQLATET